MCGRAGREMDCGCVCERECVREGIVCVCGMAEIKGGIERERVRESERERERERESDRGAEGVGVVAERPGVQGGRVTLQARFVLWGLGFVFKAHRKQPMFDWCVFLEKNTRKKYQHQGGLIFKASRLLYHSTLGSRVIKKNKKHGTYNKVQTSVCPWL